jgi:hypothetical protein
MVKITNREAMVREKENVNERKMTMRSWHSKEVYGACSTSKSVRALRVKDGMTVREVWCGYGLRREEHGRLETGPGPIRWNTRTGG